MLPSPSDLAGCLPLLIFILLPFIVAWATKGLTVRFPGAMLSIWIMALLFVAFQAIATGFAPMTLTLLVMLLATAGIQYLILRGRSRP